MKPRHVIAAAAMALGLAGLVAGCSSNRDPQGSQGSLALALGASGAPDGTTVPSSPAGGDDALSHVKAAVLTIAGIEARMSDGTWVAVETGLPASIDVVAVMNAGKVATLPADLLPEGDYDSLGLRITVVQLTLQDGALLAIAPQGTGWTARVPVNFSITAGRSTIVELSLHGSSSFQRFDGAFGFDPEFAVIGVDHH